jgi:NTE family protein
MRSHRLQVLVIFAALLVLGGCATRPVNPPISHVDRSGGYGLHTRQQHCKNLDKDNLVILAFSGGGTRAAAFSYGVLEFLRDHELVAPSGERIRLLDTVNVITGVSGGSFTALAYGLYGDRLFDVYEAAFLKRNVQGELIARALNPGNWTKLSSTGWGRSELAAELYDEILFKGATFGDLDRGDGPLIMASATDISNGGRVVFQQEIFNVLCSDLNGVRLSRAAAASSAVPVVLSPVTINNYGGSCGYALPPWLKSFTNLEKPPRPAARALRELQTATAYTDSVQHPYIHLVDGGVSDNLGMRGVLDSLHFLEALRDAGLPSPLDHVKKIVVFVVNSLSSRPTRWDQSENGPGSLEVLIKASGVPIDHYSYEGVELLRDIAARWEAERRVRALAGCSANKDLPVCAAVQPPQAQIYAIDVSFDALSDKGERDFLNQQPTSFVLSDEAVDRLRTAAGRIIQTSPDVQRLLRDTGSRIEPMHGSRPMLPAVQ